jgi:hydrogenase maturation protease
MRVLVAGVGNVFLGDDGFGVELARRLMRETLPEGVRVADFGTGGIHLAFELLDGYDTLILLDARPQGADPGTLEVVEVEPPGHGHPGHGHPGYGADGHGLHPEAVLRAVAELGGRLPRVLLVGCEPASVEERLGVSEEVRAAVEAAVPLVRSLAEAEVAPRPRPEADEEGSSPEAAGRPPAGPEHRGPPAQAANRAGPSARGPSPAPTPTTRKEHRP